MQCDNETSVLVSLMKKNGSFPYLEFLTGLKKKWTSDPMYNMDSYCE